MMIPNQAPPLRASFSWLAERVESSAARLPGAIARPTMGMLNAGPIGTGACATACAAACIGSCLWNPFGSACTQCVDTCMDHCTDY